MLGRVAICAALFLPASALARAPSSLVVFQIGHDDEAVDGVCARDACRATVPVVIDDDVCVLNVRAGALPPNDVGRIDFALGPCHSGRGLFVQEGRFASSYGLDRLGAFTHEFVVPYGPEMAQPLYDDGRRYGAIVIRLDIIANGVGDPDRPLAPRQPF